MNKLIFLDMDDVIADFSGHPAFEGKLVRDPSPMFEPGFFAKLKPVEGALVSVRTLLHMGYEIQILTQPVAFSADSYADKVRWIALHFPELISCINMTQNKGLFVGGYLIDDNVSKWKAKFEANGGKFVHFNYYSFHSLEWKNIVRYFELEKERE